jgi:hypothetical protein
MPEGRGNRADMSSYNTTWSPWRKDKSFEGKEDGTTNKSFYFLPVGGVLPTASGGDSQRARELLQAVPVVGVFISFLTRVRGWNFTNHRHWPRATCHATQYPKQRKKHSVKRVSHRTVQGVSGPKPGRCTADSHHLRRILGVVTVT